MTDIKANEPTLNRPEAKRLINAPAVFSDLSKEIEKLRSESAWHKNDRNAITIFKSGGVTTVLTALHEDAVIEDLEAGGLVTLQVLEGSICVTGEQGAQTIENKQLMVFHQGQKLQVKAEKESVILLTVIREGDGEIF